MEVKQTFFVTEPRLLSPDEQVSFCKKVVDTMGDVEVKCVVLSQLLASAPAIIHNRRYLSETFTLEIEYEVSATEIGVADQIVSNLNSDQFQTEAAETIEMDVVIDAAALITSSPTSSPTGTPTSSPTRPDVCTILTSSVFDALAPNAESLYSHADFCTAVNDWNANNPNVQIFMSGITELDRRHELAAFFGNVLHETGDFVYPREIAPCGTNTADGGNTYCQPTGYSGGNYDDPYCDPNLTPGTDPDGCNCATVTDSTVSGYLDANELFFGRGPMQLSWSKFCQSHCGYCFLDGISNCAIHCLHQITITLMPGMLWERICARTLISLPRTRPLPGGLPFGFG